MSFPRAWTPLDVFLRGTRTYMDIHTHSQCRHSHSPALCCTGQSLLRTEYANKLSRHLPYLSLFRALKTQADNFAHLCVLQMQLSTAAEAVQGSEEGSCMHCPYISSSAVPREGQGRAWPCPSCWDTPGGAGFWEAQGFERHRLGSSHSAGSSRDWEGEWVISGDKTRISPTGSEQDFRGSRKWHKAEV